MKTQSHILIFLLTITLAACKTTNIVIPIQLKENTSVFNVSGRHGWQFNQVISYGDYYTSEVSRDWGVGYDFPFALRFQGASEKLSFVQYTQTGSSANVVCISRFKNVEAQVINDYFAIELEHEDYFAGSVISKSLNWDFIIHEPDRNSLGSSTVGYIINHNDQSQKISVRGIKDIEGQHNWLNSDINGFEFSLDGKAIGAVSLLNNGKVWIRNELSADKKLVLTSVMTGLMVRHGLSESFDDT